MISSELLSDLLSALDLALFEEISADTFRPIGRTPEWLMTSTTPGVSHLCKDFPLVDLYYSDFQAAWNSGSGSVSSDVWTQVTEQGDEQYLQAVALAIPGKRWLIIRKLPAEMFATQQFAHDVSLAKEKIERLNRELDVQRMEAERATQSKTEFLNRMSHEFRGPLNALIGLSSILKTTSLNDEQEQLVRLIERAGSHLLTLINESLDLAKIEAGRIDLENVPFSLRQTIDSTTEVLEKSRSSNGLTLRVEVMSDIPDDVIGDPNRLHQILVNLLGNAFRFTERGEVVVRVSRESTNGDAATIKLHFRVEDTGIGIPRERIESVFDDFAQADRSTARKYGGTGLGLSISKRLVGLMGGTIWAESEEGKGSTFHFTAVLGLSEKADFKQKEETTAKTPDTIFPRLTRRVPEMRILLAEDDEDNQFLIRTLLTNTSVLLDSAVTGQGAITLFRERHYDLVLMDIEMPRMRGLEATRAVRTIEAEKGSSTTPILALTAHSRPEFREAALGAGITEILTKPLQVDQLLQALIRFGPQRTRSIGAPQDSYGQRILVRLEAEIGQMAIPYVERRRGDVAQYRNLLADGNLEEIALLAHRVKGTGSGYGFQELTEFSDAIERAARDGEHAQLPQLIDRVADFFERLEIDYKS